MALTPGEDEELRRIHTLAQFGDLPPAMQARYDELRAANEQIAISEPTIEVTWQPTNRNGRPSDITLYEDVDMIAAYSGSDVEPRPAGPRSMSIAAMAEFEAALTGLENYQASPFTGGFAPSTWFGRADVGIR